MDIYYIIHYNISGVRVLDNNNIAKLIEGNVILVTGDGGSIGSKLCRQIMTFNPKKLVIVDIYENNLYDIEIEFKAKYGNKNIDALVVSVRDKKAIEIIFVAKPSSITIDKVENKLSILNELVERKNFTNKEVMKQVVKTYKEIN